MISQSLDQPAAVNFVIGIFRFYRLNRVSGVQILDVDIYAYPVAAVLLAIGVTMATVCWLTVGFVIEFCG